MIHPLKLSLVALFIVGAVLRVRAENAVSASPSAVQIQRAEKIVAALGLPDADRAARVRDLVARQYYDLSLIHAARDTAIKAAKEKNDPDKTATDAAIKQARDDAEAAQNKLHPEYLARLAAELTSAQIDQVKDGMTYGVLPITYRVYMQELPNLTDAQKTQLMAWLVEAREHAMDGSTSGEKHAWFGKYKGKINNYLSAAGYDMKKAEKEMLARQKSASSSN